MQREISAAKERELENRNTMMHSDKQLKDQALSLDELRKQNQDLKDILVQLKEQYKAAMEDRDCFHRTYVEKDSECKDLQKSITKLVRTTSEQEKTIGELRYSLIEKVEGNGNAFSELNNNRTKNLQAEQIRLTGVEQALRKEVDSYKLEAKSLRHENIELMIRLMCFEQDGSPCTHKIDWEMRARIECLQNQGLSFLKESSQMCSKLQAVIKPKPHTTNDTQLAVETIRNGLDEQFMIESGVKIQGFKRGIESLTKSLQRVSVLLNQKRDQAALSNCELQSGIKPTSEVTDYFSNADTNFLFIRL